MRLARTADGIAFQVSERLEEAGFIAAFSERTGGASEGPFRSLNLGLRAGDDPGRAAENRRRLVRALGVDAFACVRQVHGDRILRAGASSRGRGFLDPATALGDADGMVTDVHGLAVAVLTADCVPIALGDPETGQIAVVHAGWRGVAAGVLDRAVALFARPASVVAAVGPAVGPDHYEVGEDVLAAVGAGTKRGAVVQGRRGAVRRRLDLAATVEQQLRELGLPAVERAEGCTGCLVDRFFSHRRDGTTGRQAVIALRAQ